LGRINHPFTKIAKRNRKIITVKND